MITKKNSEKISYNILQMQNKNNFASTGAECKYLIEVFSYFKLSAKGILPKWLGLTQKLF